MPELDVLDNQEQELFQLTVFFSDISFHLYPNVTCQSEECIVNLRGAYHPHIDIFVFLCKVSKQKTFLVAISIKK